MQGSRRVASVKVVYEAERVILAWHFRSRLDGHHLLGLVLGWRERLRDRLDAHVAAGDGPLVVLLGEQAPTKRTIEERSGKCRRRRCVGGSPC